jgi:hypothetical protein
MPGEKFLQQNVKIANKAGSQVEAGIEQNGAVLLKVERPLPEVDLRPQKDWIRFPVEVCKPKSDGVETMTIGGPLSDEAIEHSPLIQAVHFHHPINHSGAFANCETVNRNTQGDGADIDIGGEPPVQFHFRAACHVPLRDR